MYAVPSIIFAIGLWMNSFYPWIYSIGVTAIPIGALISQERISIYFTSLDEINFPDESSKWLLSAVAPFFIILISILVITIKQSVKFMGNQTVERISGIIGFLLSVLLLWGEFLPWVKSVYKATSTQWQFKGSGTQLLIEECCYMNSFELVDAIKIILPITFIALLFLSRVLGYGIPTLMFASGLVWCFQESIDFLTGLGIQSPLENTNWTSQEVETYGLSHLKEGMLGGYLFVFSLIGVVITLLIPRVYAGRNLSEKREL
jgi:hypothetical protein